MAAKFSDREINELISEPKLLPKNYKQMFQMRPKQGHNERELYAQGTNGHEFCIILRQSRLNPLSFSVILTVKMEDSNQLFRLRRYNGKHGEHTNLIEGNTIYGFHVHIATERYQDFGAREDGYAELTNRYANFNEALHCMLTDCGFIIPDGSQLTLF